MENSAWFQSMGRSVRYAVAVRRNADGAGANGASVVEISNISHVLKQAFSAGVQVNRLKEPNALEFTPIGFGCMRQVYFRPEVLNRIIERSPRSDIAWLEQQLALPQNAAQLKLFDHTMTQAMQQTDEQKVNELAGQGFEQLAVVLRERGYPVVKNSLSALGDVSDQPEFENYWLEAAETPQCKAYNGTHAEVIRTVYTSRFNSPPPSDCAWRRFCFTLCTVTFILSKPCLPKTPN